MSIYILTTLDGPAGTNATFARGINGSGQIVGYYDNNGSEHGFIYSGGTYTTLDDPLSARGGTSGTDGDSINDAGQVVGLYADIHGLGHGFLYSGGTYTTLDDPLGVGTTNATGINNVGQVVGFYQDNSGGHGFATARQVHREFGQTLILPLRPAIFDRHVPSVDETGLAHALTERSQQVFAPTGRPAIEPPDCRHFLLLRKRRQWPRKRRRRRAAEQGNELATLHSITSSARASSVGGTSRPSPSALFKLMTSSYLVGACTGRSAAFSPLRMRST
jgi:probable HAF family extracellular repeat protein